MREALTLNKNALNQHAKHLLTQLPESDPEQISPTASLSHLYLLRLMEWFLNQADQPYHTANQEMMEEKLMELMHDMTPQEAWTWLNLGKRNEAIQEAQTPRQAAYEATEILRMQLFSVHQEQDQVR